MGDELLRRLERAGDRGRYLFQALKHGYLVPNDFESWLTLRGEVLLKQPVDAVIRRQFSLLFITQYKITESAVFDHSFVYYDGEMIGEQELRTPISVRDEDILSLTHTVHVH